MEKELLSEEFAWNLLSWRNSGLSIDNSVRLTDAKSQESLAEYIARPPLSLKKIRYEPFKGKVLFHTRYSDYLRRTSAFVENRSSVRRLGLLGRGSRDEAVSGFVQQFAARTARYVPPGRVQLIRRYGPLCRNTSCLCWQFRARETAHLR